MHIYKHIYVPLSLRHANKHESWSLRVQKKTLLLRPMHIYIYSGAAAGYHAEAIGSFYARCSKCSTLLDLFHCSLALVCSEHNAVIAAHHLTPVRSPSLRYHNWCLSAVCTRCDVYLFCETLCAARARTARRRACHLLEQWSGAYLFNCTDCIGSILITRRTDVKSRLSDLNLNNWSGFLLINHQ